MLTDRETVIRMAREAGVFESIPVPQIIPLERFAAAVEANCVPQWQPIETAPRDKSILAWIPHIELPGAVYWHNGKWHWVTNGGWAGFPTYWMPLPAAPAPKEES